MNLDSLARAGYRCDNDRLAEFEMLFIRVVLPDTTSNMYVTDSDDNTAPEICRMKFLAEALCRFWNCGGTPAELAKIIDAFNQLPQVRPALEYVATVKAGEDFDHMFRDSAGAIYMVRPDVCARVVNTEYASVALASNKVDEFDIFAAFESLPGSAIGAPPDGDAG